MLHYLGVFLLGFSIGTLAMIWAWWVYDALPEMEALKGSRAPEIETHRRSAHRTSASVEGELP